LIDPLGEEVPQGMDDVGGMALIIYGVGEACGEAYLEVDAPEQEHAKIGRQGTPLEIGADGMASDGRKTQLFWSRIGHKQTFFGLYGIAVAQTLFYQRLEEGLPFFMNNSG
jgi:hypothetical protein